MAERRLDRERKLAGVLIEARPPEWAVIGVGLNLAIAEDDFPDDLRWPATSLGHGVGTDRRWRRCGSRSGAGWRRSRTTCASAFASRDALRGREIAWEGAGGAGGSGVGGRQASTSAAT